MSRYRKAIYLCLAGMPMVTGSMLLHDNAWSTSLILGFLTTVISLTGMHVGI